MLMMSFFFNDTATTEIYTLSLHDALPILSASLSLPLQLGDTGPEVAELQRKLNDAGFYVGGVDGIFGLGRSEEHTSELQSRQYLVCRLLLEKKKNRVTLERSCHYQHTPVR